ncbi:hypothetical protein [Flagellimonas meridianipacifica]|uniref:Uncharacterized protein n=1 Tax=Flagellimonas meridianipacifica TaxID=1080225 RepID=A0A2T0M8Z7_9FLAO|nr:hypothetical protein [Allomuricauda pacifica]PRX53945.1 hypothetical protein CLV81_2338 [Allomuricauda pacifica]
MKKRYWFGLVVLLVSFAHGQTSLGEDKAILYKSPSKKFHDITLQAHNGLPRFGVPNNYLPVGQKQTRGAYTPEIRKKQALTNTGYQNYSIMVSLKYLEPFMKDLDTDRLTITSGNKTETQRNSAFLQSFLRNEVGTSICATEDCKNVGQGKNEFERLRNYKAFVESCLAPLRQWSTTFFENDEIVAYHVSQIGIGRNYDFDQRGYWVSHNFGLNNIFRGGIKKVIFKPQTPYEHTLKNKLGRGLGLQFLLELDEKEAEKYQMSSISRLYLVKKIRLKYVKKELTNAQKPVEFNYSHESPEFAVYEDAALTKLVTKLSLKNLILKTN